MAPPVHSLHHQLVVNVSFSNMKIVDANRLAAGAWSPCIKLAKDANGWSRTGFTVTEKHSYYVVPCGGSTVTSFSVPAHVPTADYMWSNLRFEHP